MQRLSTPHAKRPAYDARRHETRAGRAGADMKPLILIVEDEPGIADTLQYALRTEGFEPAWSSSGEAALAAAVERPPALVILDVGLPDINGFELFKRLREQIDVPV